MRPIDQREIDDLKIYCQPIEDEPGWYTCPPEEMTQVFLRYLKVGLSRIAMIISLKSGKNLEGTMKIRDFTTFEFRNKKGETSQHELEDLAEWKLRLE